MIMHAYLYGTPIRVWDIILAHTRMGYPIRVWDVPYAYGPIYAYGAEHTHLVEVHAWKYTSRASKHVKVHVSWKHMCGGICMEGIRVKQKTRVLTRINLPIESIALHYINFLLVDQHNVTYGVFSSAYVYKILMNF